MLENGIAESGKPRKRKRGGARNRAASEQVQSLSRSGKRGRAGMLLVNASGP